MNKKYINIILLVLWCIFIFAMSSFNADDSTTQSDFFVSIISREFNFNNLTFLAVLIRKVAHFLEYLILGVLSINCFKKHFSKYLIISIFFCIIYAFSDEIHQLFIDGRSCQVLDVFIDSIGSLSGIFAYKLLNKEVKHEN